MIDHLLLMKNLISGNDPELPEDLKLFWKEEYWRYLFLKQGWVDGMSALIDDIDVHIVYKILTIYAYFYILSAEKGESCSSALVYIPDKYVLPECDYPTLKWTLKNHDAYTCVWFMVWIVNSFGTKLKEKTPTPRIQRLLTFFEGHLLFLLGVKKFSKQSKDITFSFYPIQEFVNRKRYEHWSKFLLSVGIPDDYKIQLDKRVQEEILRDLTEEQLIFDGERAVALYSRELRSLVKKYSECEPDCYPYSRDLLMSQLNFLFIKNKVKAKKAVEHNWSIPIGYIYKIFPEVEFSAARRKFALVFLKNTWFQSPMWIRSDVIWGEGKLTDQILADLTDKDQKTIEQIRSYIVEYSAEGEKIRQSEVMYEQEEADILAKMKLKSE